MSYVIELPAYSKGFKRIYNKELEVYEYDKKKGAAISVITYEFNDNELILKSTTKSDRMLDIYPQYTGLQWSGISKAIEFNSAKEAISYKLLLLARINGLLEKYIESLRKNIVSAIALLTEEDVKNLFPHILYRIEG